MENVKEYDNYSVNAVNERLGKRERFQLSVFHQALEVHLTKFIVNGMELTQ